PHLEKVSVEVLHTQRLARRPQHRLRVVPVYGPTPRLGRGRQGLAVHHPVSIVLRAVVLDSLGNRWWKRWAPTKGDTKDMRYRRRDRVQCQHSMPLRRHAHALYELHGLVEREPLAFAVMRNLGQALAHEFHPAAVKKRPIPRHRYQHRPTAMIRYPNDAAILRHDVPSR